LLSALFRLVPVDLYEPRFKDLVQVLLTKMHQKKYRAVWPRLHRAIKLLYASLAEN